MGSELNMWWLGEREFLVASDRVPTAIPLRLPFVDLGPHGFERFVRGHQKPSYTTAYGSFIADEPRRLFILYIAEYEVGGARGIDALVERARSAWSDWRVIWAFGGGVQMARVLARLRRPPATRDRSVGAPLEAWLDDPGSPEALRSWLGPSGGAAHEAPSEASARCEIETTFEHCWADARATAPGAGDLHPHLFRDAASGGGSDVVFVEDGARHSARVPATTPVLLVDPHHVGEVLRSARGSLLAPVDPTAPHGPPEALCLDADRREVHVLPTPANIHALLELFDREAWRGWSLRFGLPREWPPSGLTARPK